MEGGHQSVGGTRVKPEGQKPEQHVVEERIAGQVGLATVAGNVIRAAAALLLVVWLLKAGVWRSDSTS